MTIELSLYDVLRREHIFRSISLEHGIDMTVRVPDYCTLEFARRYAQRLFMRKRFQVTIEALQRAPATIGMSE